MSNKGGREPTPLPCASGPVLLGEAALRHKANEGRWGEDPNPAQDTHLSFQLTLPPLSTGPDQPLERGLLDILPFVRLAHIMQPANDSGD